MKKLRSVFNALLYLVISVTLVSGVLCYAESADLIGGISGKTLGIIQIGLSIAAFIGATVYILLRKKRVRNLIESVSASFAAGAAPINNTMIPVMMVVGNKIEWYNAAFGSMVLEGKECLSEDVESIIPQGLSDIVSSRTRVSVKNRNYDVFVSSDNEEKICFFIDTTQFDELRHEFDLTRPVVGYITVDNLDELARGVKDSEKADMTAIIEHCIEEWSNSFNCMIKKLATDRFIVITDKRGLDKLRREKFDILKKVRTINFGEKGNVTLSIGFGHEGGDFEHNESFARDALDMALGRGGDQATVRNGSDYEFFGGTASTGSKRSRVRTRVVASSLLKLIDESDNVIIMGHKNADLDCVGSAFGLSRAAAERGKPVNIVINQKTCLCNNMVDYISKENPVAVTPGEALSLVSNGTLLIITDTHRRAFLESPELFDKCQTVAIIDHHRKTVDYIDNSVIFYHEPYSSSASEMVTELIQHMTSKISRTEADALLAGITLDTRSFVLHTSSRTFEASAYLRACGANPVIVKGFFQNSVDVFKERASLVSTATIYGQYAISYSRNTGNSVMVAASQAADELLGIDGINASFVFFSMGDFVNISARSLGAVNVQLIMERLGGGGHLTMAAAQLAGVTLEQAMVKLIGAIDEYNSDNS